MTALKTTVDMFDLRMSEAARPLFDAVKQFIETAFSLVGLDWSQYVETDEAYMRPAEVAELRGDPSKAAAKLGWKPTTTFDELVREMIENDLRLEGLDPAQHIRKPSAGVAR